MLLFVESVSNPAGIKLTDRQKEIAAKATGYQYDRPLDALQFKLNLFLEQEMRKWEKTFPDQLWVEIPKKYTDMVGTVIEIGVGNR